MDGESPSLKGVTHLLVDLDGTLLDAHELILGGHFIWEIIRYFKGKFPMRDTLKILGAVRAAVEGSPTPELNSDRAARVIAENLKTTPDEAKSLIAKSIDSIFPKLERRFWPKPGAADFIQWAHGKFPLVLATNPVWAPHIVEMRLKWSGIERDLFSSITHAEKMHACKPHPEYFREILEQEGLEPHHCLLIGNDMRKDFPATQTGIRVYIISNEKTAQSVPVYKGSAPCWRGTYPALQKLISEHCLS